jgi:hypothetical protein
MKPLKINSQSFQQKENMLMTIECLWTSTDTSGKSILPNLQLETSQMSVTMVAQLPASLETNRLQQLRWFSSAASLQSATVLDICLVREA